MFFLVETEFLTLSREERIILLKRILNLNTNKEPPEFPVGPF